MMIDRPMVAVTPLMDYGKDSLWMLPGYMDAVLRAGGTPVMLPLTDDAAVVAQCAERFDAFLFTGGPDVGPSVGPDSMTDCTGDATDDATGRGEVLSPERDRMESLLLPSVMRLDKPILGICRGVQFINRFLGGTLWRDLPTEHPGEIEHHMKPPYDAFGHTVTLTPGTPLAKLFTGESEIPVNSYHHQAVREPAPGLRVMATAPDGVIEALWRPASRFLWAVQWHPEFLYQVDSRSQAIFDTFVTATRTTRNR
ncbi:gamma-glutamyl-gamma-aminobutyrate hydrolase family protein [Bifidobacterium stellenboschense]|uniref:Putative glutamine amidotransferase n=1 Tax=Bifidobacterium stellenboschense TaxID=762211 RepID=A0A087DAM6_9BIFI|nr:gamma-glutamyl-gamma-aminobutyrate hydrolase family protein [Bifidobacterium stellenboschense]KFI92576.1 putative glutamine amidotransferase [Bifidobacterium stellenboschense]